MDAAGQMFLVLDDDASVARTLAFVAEAQGFIVQCHDEPQAFLDAVERHRPAVVALDLVMPHMDGIEVLRQLASRGCEAGVILTSGMGQKVLEAARATAIERGLDILGVLPKPFRPVQLRELLARRPTRARAPRAVRDAALPPPSVADLREAIAGGAIHVVAQPKLEIATGRILGAEALARWSDPRFGHVPPDVFVPLAEQHGLLGPLTEAVLDRALGWFRASPLSARGSLAVNLSTRSLVDVDLADRVLRSCERHAVSPSRLVLEITETSAMEHTADSFDTLTRLRLKGFRLSIDDFGTGYSSLAQLARLPLSEIKIDRSFVALLGSSADAAKIVDATIQLARAMGLDCVAEGVEDQATLDALVRLGCGLAQGYHIARPMPGADFDRWLEARQSAAH